MKNKIKILVAAFISLIFLGSCEKTYMEPVTPSTSAKNRSVTEDDKSMGPVNPVIIIGGMWRISLFQKNNRGNNQVSVSHDNGNSGLFKDYIFKFEDNGILTAIHADIKERGKWAKHSRALIISFGSLVPLNQLNNDKWVVINNSVNHIELEGMNSLNNSPEVLVFERIMVY